MEYKELVQIGNEVLDQIKSSPNYADIYENSLKNIRDSVIEINKKNLRSSFYGEENILISEPTNVFDDNAILTDRNFENANSEFNFNDIIPPQIKQRSTPEPAPMHAPSAIQRSIQPIFNQTLVSSGIGNNVDSLIAQASQVPFLYHNQQL